MPAEHERRHRPGGDGWSEELTFSLWADDASLGATIRLVFHPALGRAWYIASVVRAGHPLVTVIDLEVPLPASPSSLEVRSSGLWADHNVETPVEHWSVGLEAFGVALDDPGAALTGAYGDRTPLGFDLEWEAAGPEAPWPPPLGGGGEGYAIGCRAHGEILLGAETIEVDGPGARTHRWGSIDWLGGTEGMVTGRTGDADRARATEWLHTSADELYARDLDLDPGPWATVPLTVGDGRCAALTSTLMRFHRAGEAVGAGWVDHSEVMPCGS